MYKNKIFANKNSIVCDEDIPPPPPLSDLSLNNINRWLFINICKTVSLTFLCFTQSTTPSSILQSWTHQAQTDPHCIGQILHPSPAPHLSKAPNLIGKQSSPSCENRGDSPTYRTKWSKQCRFDGLYVGISWNHQVRSSWNLLTSILIRWTLSLVFLRELRQEVMELKTQLSSLSAVVEKGIDIEGPKRKEQCCILWLMACRRLVHNI